MGTFADGDDVVVAEGVLRALPAPGARHPDVNLLHLADDTGLDQLDDAAVVLGGVDLDAHLGRHLRLRRLLADLARLEDVVGERLLAVDVLAVLQGQHGRRRVRVLAGADDHGVEGGGMVKELAEVGELFGVAVFGPGRLQGGAAHVAQRDDVLGGDGGEVGGAPAAHTDQGDVELVGRLAGAQEGGCGQGGAGGGEEGAASEERRHDDPFAVSGLEIDGQFPRPFYLLSGGRPD
jgi:hypothetical protein